MEIMPNDYLEHLNDEFSRRPSGILDSDDDSDEADRDDDQERKIRLTDQSYFIQRILTR